MKYLDYFLWNFFINLDIATQNFFILNQVFLFL